MHRIVAAIYRIRHWRLRTNWRLKFNQNDYYCYFCFVRKWIKIDLRYPIIIQFPEDYSSTQNTGNTQHIRDTEITRC